MNIVISLDCSPDKAECILDGIKGVLSAQGLETTSYELVDTTVIHGLPKAVDPQPAIEPELPPEPMGDPIGIPPAEVAFVPEPPPEISVSPSGIVAMVNMSPMGDEPAAELPAEPFVEPEPEPEVPAPVFGDVRVLTLSTSFLIPSTVVPGKTTLKVIGPRVNDGIVRFTYSGFEYALPIAEQGRQDVANTNFTSGPMTVRLVIDIANKTFPCLVDLDDGQSEELLVGDDLISAIEETDANVPAE